MRAWRPYPYVNPTAGVTPTRGRPWWGTPGVTVYNGRTWAVQPTRAYYFGGRPVGLFVWTRNTRRTIREKFGDRRRRRR